MTAAQDSPLQFHRDSEGRLLLDRPGREPVRVRVVRLFPFTVPEGPVSIVGEEGHELALIPTLSALAAAPQAMLREEVATREFLSVVQRVVRASSTTLPAQWDLETDRGPITITLRDEDAFRNLPGGELLVTDAGGTRFLVRRIEALDRRSRTILRQHV